MDEIDIFTDERKILVMQSLPVDYCIYEEDTEEYIVVSYEYFRAQVLK